MTNDEGMKALEDAFLKDQLVNLKFEYADKSYVTGWASITEMSVSAPHAGGENIYCRPLQCRFEFHQS